MAKSTYKNTFKSKKDLSFVKLQAAGLKLDYEKAQVFQNILTKQVQNNYIPEQVEHVSLSYNPQAYPAAPEHLNRAIFGNTTPSCQWFS